MNKILPIILLNAICFYPEFVLARGGHVEEGSLYYYIFSIALFFGLVLWVSHAPELFISFGVSYIIGIYFGILAFFASLLFFVVFVLKDEK